MRFFRMQDQARRRSRRLVGWYCLAFAGTVASVSAVLGTLSLGCRRTSSCGGIMLCRARCLLR